jgi:signal transduction histidine kinase
VLPRLKFRHRISLLVLLAGVALVIVTTVTLVLGRENQRQLAGIETRYVPLIELDGTLKRLYLSVTRTLEDAAGAGETGKIVEADKLSEQFRARLSEGSRVVADNGGDPAMLETKFLAYYSVAREVSAALASGAPFQDLGDKIETMRRAQREFSVDLDAATSPNRARLAAAFATARNSQTTSLQIDIVVASIALLLMALISWRIIRRTIKSLHAVAEGVERLALGDFGHPIDVPGGDEFGDLGREANRTAQRLREYREQSDRENWIKSGIAELAERTAGEQSPEALAKNAMLHLTGYIGAACAAIFVDDSDGTFRLTGSTGTGVADVAPRFQRDDQTRLGALVRETTIATHDGDQCVCTSGPYEVALPLSHEGRVLGLLLFGLREQANARTVDLLGRVAGMIGIALQVANSRERARAMLLETQRQARAAETANKELEAFSYSVSHDLRAPLRAIHGFSQALEEDERAKLSADGQNHLRRIRAAAQRMAELIDDLLRLSRVSRSDFRRDNVDVSALAETVVTELRRAYPDRTLDVSIQGGVMAHADARLTRIVLENLIGNAWKFTAKAPNARIELGTRDDGGQLVYFVRDNGAGFDMKYADRLFGAFQRLHSDKEFPGTGIGLATVQRIVLRHGGRIWVEAAVGAGATFQFTLPRESSSRTALPDPAIAHTT